MLDDLPKLYTELASWWPILSKPGDYAEEAGFYCTVLRDACHPPPREVLELGGGGGNNASHMKAHFRLTLVDLAPGMLEVSRRLNPECEHFEGDMRDVRLGREFDAVFVQDAVMYMTTEQDLRRAMATAFAHCRPGGVAVFAPDHVREDFTASCTNHGGHDGDDGRALRYLEWTWDSDQRDTSYVCDFVYMLREADGSIGVVQDRHVNGIFPRDTWLRLLREVGFEPRVQAFVHSELAYTASVFIAAAGESRG